MFLYPLTNTYSAAAYEFNRLRIQALKASFYAKFLGKRSILKSLSEAAQGNFQNKQNLGIQTVLTDRIIGTVSRNDDFDLDFRPRKKHLRDRWINMFVLQHEDRWAPIVVHKFGDEYYVEDGHHRVSVARMVGMMFIEAEVWDHPREAAPPVCHISTCLPLSSARRACVVN